MERWRRRYEEAGPQRVNRWLAQAGVCSRREAEALIARGLVRIDGAPVEDAGRKILPGQTLVLLQDAQATGDPATIVLHKPVGVVSAQPEPGQTPAARLLTRAALWPQGAAAEPPGRDDRLAPAGRLDKDSRGLLVLTQDGVVAKAAIGPQSQLDKAYRVRVEGAVTDVAVARLRHGLELDGRRLKPAVVERLGGQALAFTLREGRNRQIRRMCELVGLEVVDLLRTRIGPLELGDLPQGRWRPMTDAERTAFVTAAAAPG